MREVVVKFIKDLQQEIKVGPHTLYSDEQEEFGGEDRGPNPYDLMLAALGTCTSMTLFGYARRKGWHLDDVQVVLNHERVYAKDCEECETTEGRLDVISRRIMVKGELSDEQKEKLLEIAKKCPVNRTIAMKAEVIDRLG